MTRSCSFTQLTFIEPSMNTKGSSILTAFTPGSQTKKGSKDSGQLDWPGPGFKVVEGTQHE